MTITAEMIGDFIATWEAWGASVDQLNAWSMGTAGGGPGGDGRYPLTNRAGTVVLIPCPAKIASLVPTGQPMMMSIDCYSDDEAVQANARAGWRFAPRALTIAAIGASVLQPDQSPVGTDGIRIDLLVDGASILSTPLRILPGVRMSWAAGTSQPTIVAPTIARRSEIVVAVLSGGVGALGLKIDIEGHYA